MNRLLYHKSIRDIIAGNGMALKKKEIKTYYERKNVFATVIY